MIVEPCSHLLVVALLTITAPVRAQSGAAILHSPDHRLEISFRTAQKDQPNANIGQLSYSVSFQGKPLIQPSALHLDLQGMPPLGQNARIANVSTSEFDSSYKVIAAKASTVRDRHNALRVEVEETGGFGRKLILEARAFMKASS